MSNNLLKSNKIKSNNNYDNCIDYRLQNMRVQTNQHSLRWPGEWTNDNDKTQHISLAKQVLLSFFNELYCCIYNKTKGDVMEVRPPTLD